MFLLIVVFSLTLLVCWVLPLLGTLFSKNKTQKWILFWLLSIVLSYTLYPLLEYMLDCEYIMIIQIVAALGSIFVLSKQQKTQKIIGLADKVAKILREKKQAVKAAVFKTLSQNDLIQAKA